MSALTRFSIVGAIVLTMIGPMVGQVVSAQSTPVADRYVREGQGYAGEFADVFSQLDEFWFGTFQEVGIAYRSPTVFSLDGEIMTGCGPASPRDFAFYCSRDEAIFYSPAGFSAEEARIGDFVPIVVMSHEWGHHVQLLLGIRPEPGNAFELQADCFAGAYANEAGQQGLLDPGDITEAVLGSADAGDPLGLPQDAPGAHGINDDRVVAFMRGYLDGVSGCGWTPTAVPQETVEPTPVEASRNDHPSDGSGPRGRTLTDIPLLSLLPLPLELSQGQPFWVESEGVSTIADMVAAFPDAERSRQLLADWGWEENVYRIYASQSPPPNAVGWMSLSIHRFSSVDGAAAALPLFAENSRNNLGYVPVDVGLFADQAQAFTGQAYNGRELVIYARRGNLVFRVAGIARNGDPNPDVFETLLIPLRQLAVEPAVVSPELFDLLPSEAQVGASMSLAEVHARSAGTIVTTFPNVAEAERLFQAWGWRESASYVYTGRMKSGTDRLEVSVFRLADDQAAEDALTYFVDARAASLALSSTVPPRVFADQARAITGRVGASHEVSVYLRRGSYLYRVTSIGNGDPMADLAELFVAW